MNEFAVLFLLVSALGAVAYLIYMRRETQRQSHSRDVLHPAARSKPPGPDSPEVDKRVDPKRVGSSSRDA